MFDTWGAFGFGFVGNLNLGGPAPIGAQKAALSDKVLPYMQEIALSEQVRFAWATWQCCSCRGLFLSLYASAPLAEN